MVNYKTERDKQMNGKYIVVKADGTIMTSTGEGKVSLAFMQKKVGGLIDKIPLPFETTIDLWCDDEGLFKEYKENVIVSNYLNRVWDCGDFYHIKGDVLILGHDNDNTVWLTDEEANWIYNELNGIKATK